MVFSPVTTLSSPLLLICDFLRAALGWRWENACCVYEISFWLSPHRDTAAWHRWGPTEATAEPAIISLFPLSWLVRAWVASAAMVCKGLRGSGELWCEVRWDPRPWSPQLRWCVGLLRGVGALESSSGTGPSWLTRLCASYCSTVFHSSFDIYCSVCKVAIPLGKTSKNPIFWRFEANYFGYFEV